MSSKKSVLIDLGKLKNLYTGLGQVSMNFGKEIQTITDPALEWRFLIPKDYSAQFGTPPATEYLSFKRRYFPSLCPKHDLWHAIHQDSAYFPALSHATKYLLTIHDLNFLKEKIGRKAEARLNRLQKKADRAEALIFISEFAKAEALSALKTTTKPTFVIYNGVETSSKVTASRPAFLPEGDYLFSIGSLIKKKNFHTLIPFLAKTNDLNLVIAGHPEGEYGNYIKEQITLHNLGNRVILPGAVDDETKAYLYKNCKAFCFPSLHEGFGLPVIEAMRYGKPVFCSNLSSLPEVAGEHAFYWTNFNAEKMVEAYQQGILKFNTDKESNARTLIEYSNRYTWRQNVNTHIELYKDVLNLK